MGAELFLVHFGVRFAIADEQIDALEDGSYLPVLKAEQAGLDTATIKFEDPIARKNLIYLFVGKLLGVFGPEYDVFANLRLETLVQIAGETRTKLKLVGIEDTPELWLQWGPDY
jgi:hypothetical protein